MLQQLHIQNYAIIDDIQISFNNGLNIITGETGAGKSILMGALNLILGQRADSSVLMDGNKKCMVEGVFKVKWADALIDFFKEQDLDAGMEEILIRREINANGKSRSFINDTPVNLSQVKLLSICLVDLHQQFDTLDINTAQFQRNVLDAMAGNAELMQQMKKEFNSYSQSKKLLNDWKSQQELANKELDYHQFLYDELAQLSLKENELERLDAELKLLSDAENIKHQLTSIYTPLYTADPSLVQQIKSLQQKLGQLHSFHPDISTLAERMQAVTIELRDIADDLENIESRIRYDADRIQWVNDRIATGYKLLKKHGVQTTSDLLLLQNELEVKLQAITNLSDQIAAGEKEVLGWYEACLKTAVQISTRRKKTTDSLVKKVNALLHQVGMPNASLLIDLAEGELTESGTDRVEFLFDANKSGKAEALGKVASGGELSRLMLSIKSLVAGELALPTLIFDEIDTGISGEAARQVGVIMKSLSSEHQLIAITHQPQIAAKADTHYFVYKEIQGNQIKTAIRILNTDERIVAIAKMLSGEKPSSAALENAKEMMGN